MNLLIYEQKYWSKGVTYIAGIDEAGRGPLAGPVVAAAVILPQNIELPEVKDSKKLSEKKREKLYKEIMDQALSVGVGISHENEIDNINILQATYRAMQKAIGQLKIKPDLLLVDGKRADIKHFTQENIIKGDNLSLSIAAASIIAKVTRDRLMREYDRVFPGDGLAQHKGYGSKQHMDAILSQKATPIHRKSFRPIKDNLPSFKYCRENRLLEKLGEQLIACQLIRTGYQILEMNYNIPQIGEVDIISQYKDQLIFTEVKTQTTGHGWNEPRTQIDECKSERIMNAARHYMDENELDIEIRFDVAEVLLGNGKPKISVIEDGISMY